MASNPISAIEKVQNALKKNLEVATSTQNMSAIADIMIKNIVTRARLGKGVENGKQVNFDPLSNEYIGQRKRYSDNLDASTSPNQKKSNATATGQMLKSISKKIGVGSLLIYFKGNRKADLDGKVRRLSNSDVAGFFQKRRPFFELTSADVNEVKRYIRSIILKR